MGLGLESSAHSNGMSEGSHWRLGVGFSKSEIGEATDIWSEATQAA